MYAKLPKYELVFYFCYWLALFSKIVYHFYDYCRVLEKQSIFSSWALTQGFFLNFPYREKLDSDIMVIFDLGTNFIALGILHVILRRIIFGIFITVGCAWRDLALLLFMVLFGIFGQGYLVGFSFAIAYVILAIADWLIVQKLFAILPYIRNFSPLCRAWIMAVVQTFGLHYFVDTFFGTFSISRNAEIAFIWSLGWYQLRMVSYTDFNSRYRTGVLHFLGYIMYFPALYAPFVSYTRFLHDNELGHEDQEGETKTSSDPIQSFSAKLILFVKQYLYISLWMVLTIFANHAFFPTALAYYQEVYLEADIWTRCGHAWTMGQWFQSKYMLLYGAPWLITLLDTGIPLPDIPVFISRIYRYSVMWRRFDTGLYEFMRDHLYVPALSTLDSYVEGRPDTFRLLKSDIFRKVMALAATYAFVGIWHGLTSGVLIFAAMNYIGLIMEFTAAGVSREFGLAREMSPQWYRRLTAFICAFGVQWSWISFFYFMTDLEHGNFIVYHIFYHPFWMYVIGYFAVYAWVHLSMELEAWLDPQRAPRIQKPVQQSEQEITKKRK